LTMLQQVFFNPLREPPAVEPEPPKDLDARESFVYGLLAAVCLGLGLFPQVVLGPMKADVAVLAGIGDAARERATATPLPPRSAVTTPPPVGPPVPVPAPVIPPAPK